MPSAPDPSLRTRRPRRRPAAVAALFATAAMAVPLVAAEPAAAADPVTFLPNGGSVQLYTVPAGVSSIEVLAVGGTGGRGGSVNAEQSRAPGGRGGTVTVTIPVVEGEILEIVVGANGEGGGAVAGAPGGSPRGGRGGGKTTVFTCRQGSPCPDEGDSAIWAGGGGGGGGRGSIGTGSNGGTGASPGGNPRGGAGTTGVVYVDPALGGWSGTQTPGAGGERGMVTDCTGTHGFGGADGVADFSNNTTPGRGGDGAADGGGGGGGGGDGFRPGGGGGGAAACAAADEAHGGGAGGGAGSNRVEGAEGAVFGQDTTSTPRVVITPLDQEPPDATAPTVTIDKAAAQPDPTTSSPITFTAVFSEPVTALTAEDVTLTGPAGATVSSVVDTGDGRTFTISVTGMTASGDVTATIAAGATTDAAGNANAASTSTDNVVSFIYIPPPDLTPPLVALEQAAGQADPTSGSSIRFTATFTEPVEPLTATDVTLTGPTGATVSNVIDSGDHQTFTIEATGMTTAGTVTATIASGVTTDAAGNANLPSVSQDNVVTYVPPVEPVTPTLQITPRVDVLEGRAAQLTLTLSEPAATPVTVRLETVDGPLFGGAGSRWYALDYAGGPRTVTIPAGSTSATVDVATYLDFAFESWETFTVRIASASGGVELGNRTATVTIWDASWWWAFPR